MKTLGLDIGDKKIGLAVSDDSGVISFPRETYYRTNRRDDERYLAELVTNEKIGRIVYGLPLNMNGTYGPQAEKTEQFIKRLKQRFKHDLALADTEFISSDERLTSKMADDAMISQDMRRENRKQYVDALAASLILQNYLDRENRRQDMKDFEQLVDKHDHDHDHEHEDFDVQEVELVDDDGNVTKFVIDDWFEFDGNQYAVLVSDDEDDAVLFRVEENGEEMNFITPDEEEFDRAAQYYEELE